MAACLFLGCWGIHLHFTKSSWAIECEFRWALSAIFYISLLSGAHKISPFSLSSLNSTTLCFHSLCGWCLLKSSFTPRAEIWINICCVNYESVPWCASNSKAFFRSHFGESELQLSRPNEKRFTWWLWGTSSLLLLTAPKHLLPALPRKHTQTKARLRHIFTMVFNKLVNASAMWSTTYFNFVFMTYVRYMMQNVPNPVHTFKD